MASLIDSEAVFSARLRASDLGGLEPAFAARGWTTMSTFAFASSWVPGVGDDTAFQNAVLNPLLGRADHARAPKVRKLYFECYTMVAADIKSKIDAGPEDSSKVRKLAAAERKSRWETMKANYPHMNFKSDAMEPAHAVIDRCHTMRVDGDVKYIPPHEVPTWDQEMQSVKTEELIKRDASGHLKAQEERKVPEADTKTDLRMRQAYLRRGLALEMADVVTFTIHEKLVEKLFTEYQREPPPGYRGVTLRQMAEADRRAWKLVAEKSNGELGKRLCDIYIEEVLMDPAFVTLLLPLPGGPASSSVRDDDQDTTANMSSSISAWGSSSKRRRSTAARRFGRRSSSRQWRRCRWRCQRSCGVSIPWRTRSGSAMASTWTHAPATPRMANVTRACTSAWSAGRVGTAPQTASRIDL